MESFEHHDSIKCCAKFINLVSLLTYQNKSINSVLLQGYACDFFPSVLVSFDLIRFLFKVEIIDEC